MSILPRPDPVDDDDALGPIVDSFLRRFRRGERPALADLIARHPELADQIRDLIPALVELERHGVATGSASRAEQGRASSAASWTDEPSPERLGDYRILREVGAGGMGIVYEAEHESLRSRVALKVIHPRFRADPKFLRRFYDEARLAAGLHHTNIVGVFDYGVHDGVCYYAMQYVEGQPLDRVLDEIRRLRACDRAQDLSTALAAFTAPADPGAATASAPEPPGEPEPTLAQSIAPGAARAGRDRSVVGGRVGRGGSGEPDDDEPSLGSASFSGPNVGRYYREIARICARVADALDYAHRNGVVHRDIKPSNLILDASRIIWVTDFGLAKLEGEGDLSQSRELAGTLRYMAPERFQGNSKGRSARRGDIYALGATLYELLTLRHAFAGHEPLALMRSIQEDAPRPPRQLDRNIPRDLETIALKALAKDPNDRFGSAGELAGELRRFVEGRPIRSRPVSPFESLWRWCKREPWLAAASVSAAALVTVLAVGSTIAACVYRDQGEAYRVQGEELRVERGRAEKASIDARSRAVEAYTGQANSGRFGRRPGQRFESLEAIAEASRLLDGLPDGSDPASRRATLRDLAIAALALPDVRPARTIEMGSRMIKNADIDPAFGRYALCDDRGDCAVFRVADGSELFRCPAPAPVADGFPLFGPSGGLLAVRYPDRRLRVWRVDGPEPVLIVQERSVVASSNVLGFQPDGSLVCAFSDGSLALIDGGSGRKRPLPTGGRKLVSVASLPDGRRLAAVGDRGGKFVVEIRGLDDATPTASLELPMPVDDLAISPDGRRLAVSSQDGTIRVWEFDRPGSTPLSLTGINNVGTRLAFNHRGDMLASNGFENVLRLWDPLTGRPLLKMPASHMVPRFSADDRFLGIARRGGSMQLFEVAAGRELRTLPGDPRYRREGYDTSFAPGGRLLAVRKKEGVQLWDVGRRELLADIGSLGWSPVLFEGDGTLLTRNPGGIFRWPGRAVGPKLQFGPARAVTNLGFNGWGNLAASRDGRVLVASYGNQGAYAFLKDDPDRPIHLGPRRDVRYVAVSPDGRWAATGGFFGQASPLGLWDLANGARIAKVELPIISPFLTTPFRFSPDGRWLAVSVLGTFKFWEVGTWRLDREFVLDAGPFEFSPDGKLLAIGSGSRVRFHDPSTGRRIAALESSEQSITSYPSFSPDGSVLAVCDDESHDVQLWDLRLIRSGLGKLGLDWGGRDESAGGPEVDPPPIAPPPPIQLEVVGATPGDLEKSKGMARLREMTRNLRDMLTPRLGSAQDYHKRSLEWARLGHWEAARADAERAVRDRPDDPQWNATLGHYAYQMGDDGRAIFAGGRAVELRPSDMRSTNSLAWALLMAPPPRRDPPRALELARRVHAASPRDGGSNNTLALALARVGRDAQAIAAVGGSARPSPWDDLVLAPCYHRLGQPQRAREALAQALRWRESNPRLTSRASDDFRALAEEAKAVLAAPPPELPADVFAPDR